MTTLTEDDLKAAVDAVRRENDNRFPFTVIGVFPATTDDPLPRWWNSFAYTSGLTPNLELWMPTVSIEGRSAGAEVMAPYLNGISCAWLTKAIALGDDVLMHIGVIGGDDVPIRFWIGHEIEPASKRSVNMTKAEFCVPILWSSGMGWDD